MKPLAQVPVTMPQSGIREIANLAANRPDCIRLDLGEPNFFYRGRRDDALALLERAGMRTRTPAGAFYVMIDVSSATSDTYSFAKDLLLRRGVSVAPGETFGPAGRGFVRVSLATSAEQLASGIERLIEAVDERS